MHKASILQLISKEKHSK